MFPTFLYFIYLPFIFDIHLWIFPLHISSASFTFYFHIRHPSLRTCGLMLYHFPRPPLSIPSSSTCHFPLRVWDFSLSSLSLFIHLRPRCSSFSLPFIHSLPLTLHPSFYSSLPPSLFISLCRVPHGSFFRFSQSTSYILPSLSIRSFSFFFFFLRPH